MIRNLDIEPPVGTVLKLMGKDGEVDIWHRRPSFLWMEDGCDVVLYWDELARNIQKFNLTVWELNEAGPAIREAS